MASADAPGFSVTPWVAVSSLGPALRVPLGHLRFDPLKMDDAPFLRRLLTLDAHVFGPRNQTMPSWVLYDCALAPGAVFGLAVRRSDLAEIPESFEYIDPADDAEADAWVPISMMSTLPLPNREAVLVHTLAWLGSGTPANDELGRQTLRGALSYLGVSALRAVAGWSTPELRLFAEIGPLALRTVWTPAHDVLATVTFDLTLPAADLSPGSATPVADSELQHIQARLEAGDELWLVRDPSSPSGFAVSNAGGNR